MARRSLLAATALAAALGLSACGGGTVRGTAGRDVAVLTEPTPPSEMAGLAVQAEDITKQVSSVGDTYLKATSIYSLRKGETVQATLQISLLNELARVEDEKFKIALVTQLGGVAPSSSLLEGETVYQTKGARQQLAAWFRGRQVYVLSYRGRAGPAPEPPPGRARRREAVVVSTSATKVARGCLAAGALAAVLAGCSGTNKEPKDLKDLRAAIDVTRRTTRSFAYQDIGLTGTKVNVVGLFEDDFRFKAQLAINDVPVKEEVARDDAYATRFLDGTKLGLFVDPTKIDLAAKPVVLPAESTATSATLPSALVSLQAGRWVEDRFGAPNLSANAGSKKVIGDDPVLDALTALDYVEQTAQANGVVKYNPNALEPTYKLKEDTFEKPGNGAKLKRYDVVQSKLPKANDQGGNVQKVVVPGIENFRRMAIYVRDGQVVQVLETIDVGARLDDLKKNFDLPASTTVEKAVVAINSVRKTKGVDQFRPRILKLDFPVTGQGDTVQLPDDSEVLLADLGFLKGRGRIAVKGKVLQPTASTTTLPSADAATATTVPAPAG